MTDFFNDIKRFNQMYAIPQVKEGGEKERLLMFKRIFLEEFEELDDVLADLDNDSPVAAKIGLADLLGDLMVYAASEAERFGISIEPILGAIMQSNFSKLNPDGSPSFDERGKLLKGPNFVAPEVIIHSILFPKDSNA